MRRAIFGAVIGENRLLRTFDALAWNAWSWTPVIGLDVQQVREVIDAHGENVLALCELTNGNEAIYPACEMSRLLLSLTGKKTFSRPSIETIKKMGFLVGVASSSLNEAA